MKKYIRYRIKNLQPMKIADPSQKQSDQSETLSYIPGSSLRGVWINEYIKENGALTKDAKQWLLTRKTCFLNAYPVEADEPALPMPTCFYSDPKAKDSEVKNVFHTDPKGMKRIGSYGYFNFIAPKTISVFNIRKGENLHINLLNRSETGNTQLYRYGYIKKNTVFEGYIAIDEENEKWLLELRNILENNTEGIRIGGSISSYGLCRVTDISIIDDLPYHKQDDRSFNNKAFVYLLSDTVMPDENGILSYGLDWEAIGAQLGISNIKVVKASCSVTKVGGYNRTWKMRLPSYIGYKAGSIFEISFEGIPEAENLNNIQQQGIGLRTQEGFGQVLIWSDFSVDKVQRRDYRASEEATGQVSKDDAEYLRRKYLL